MDSTLLNNLVLLAIAIISAYTAFMTRQTHSAAAETLAVAQKTEINTNSMKDALVAATSKASHAAGLEEGRLAGEAKAATLAQNPTLQNR